MRLAFCLKDAVPMSAIEAGHVFLGFSKCGQFLLSYTQVSLVTWIFQMYVCIFIPKSVRESLKFIPWIQVGQFCKENSHSYNHCFDTN